ncbi:MAG TPA: virulence factor [Candidatus Dormibacteraeota bacterium]|nr:virulence factor [Candidatus Dormibacteraeota bacterium]
MASYQVMFWKHIPSQIKAWEGETQAKRMLPDRFQAAIDAYAMKDGSTDMDAYLDGWRWGPVEERAGSPDDVLAALVAELDGAFPRSRLMNPEPES